jgi:hypothetical protein
MWWDLLVVNSDINTGFCTRLLKDVDLGLRGVKSLDRVGALESAVSDVAFIVTTK